MRQKIVAGNWKMNGDRAFVGEFAQAFFSVAKDVLSEKEGLDIILAPPAVLISTLAEQVGSYPIGVAGQNASEHDAGAFTGEVSAPMLKDSGCEWCLVGHSERRSLYGETDEIVLAKVKALLSVGIKPILCVGETLDEREQGRAEEIVSSQVSAVYSVMDESSLQNVVIAYEPVWAIGTGVTASPEQAQEMHATIRSVVAKVSSELAQKQVILYGGSVNAANATELFAHEDIDGGLVGGASLKPQDFLAICKSV